MQGIDEGWNKEITKNTNLTDFIDGFFDFIHPVPVGEDVRRIGENYHMGDIVKSETDREIEKERLKNEYKIVFTGDSVVELVL